MTKNEFMISLAVDESHRHFYGVIKRRDVDEEIHDHNWYLNGKTTDVIVVAYDQAQRFGEFITYH